MELVTPYFDVIERKRNEMLLSGTYIPHRDIIQSYITGSDYLNAYGVASKEIGENFMIEIFDRMYMGISGDNNLYINSGGELKQ